MLNRGSDLQRNENTYIYFFVKPKQITNKKGDVFVSPFNFGKSFFFYEEIFFVCFVYVSDPCLWNIALHSPFHYLPMVPVDPVSKCFVLPSAACNMFRGFFKLVMRIFKVGLNCTARQKTRPGEQYYVQSKLQTNFYSLQTPKYY